MRCAPSLLQLWTGIRKPPIILSMLFVLENIMLKHMLLEQLQYIKSNGMTPNNNEPCCHLQPHHAAVGHVQKWRSQDQKKAAPTAGPMGARVISKLKHTEHNES